MYVALRDYARRERDKVSRAKERIGDDAAARLAVYGKRPRMLHVLASVRPTAAAARATYKEMDGGAFVGMRVSISTGRPRVAERRGTVVSFKQKKHHVLFDDVAADLLSLGVLEPDDLEDAVVAYRVCICAENMYTVLHKRVLFAFDFKQRKFGSEWDFTSLGASEPVPPPPVSLAARAYTFELRKTPQQGRGRRTVVRAMLTRRNATLSTYEMRDVDPRMQACPRVGMSARDKAYFDQTNMVGVRMLHAGKEAVVVGTTWYETAAVRRRAENPDEPTLIESDEPHVFLYVDDDEQEGEPPGAASRGDVLNGARAWNAAHGGALSRVWNADSFAPPLIASFASSPRPPTLSYAKNSAWFDSLKDSVFERIANKLDVKLLNVVGACAFTQRSANEEFALDGLLSEFAKLRERFYGELNGPLGDGFALADVLARFRMACDGVPGRVRMRALGDYLQSVGAYAPEEKPASLAARIESDSESESDDDGDFANEEDDDIARASHDADDIPFEGVFPSSLTLGMNRVKASASEREPVFQAVQTFRLSDDEWKCEYDGATAHVTRRNAAAARRATVPRAWREPAGAKTRNRARTLLSANDLRALRADGNAREIMGALAGASTANFLSYLKESGMANGAQLASTYSFVGVLVHGRLAFRAIWGNQEGGAALFARLANPGDTLDAHERADTMHVPFSALAAPPSHPVRHATMVARYRMSPPFAAMFSDALGADAVGMVAREYVDNVFKPESRARVTIRIADDGDGVAVTATEDKRARLWAEDLLPDLYPAVREPLELRIVSVELPVYNPFVAALDKRNTHRVLETRADFVAAVQTRDGTVVGLVMGEYKTLMEMAAPTGRVCADDHVAQTMTNALLLLLSTGVRVDYGLILYSTKRYTDERPRVPRAYAVAIDMRFERAGAEARKAALDFAVKVCYDPFAPATRDNDVSSLYADDLVHGTVVKLAPSARPGRAPLPRSRLAGLIDIFVTGKANTSANAGEYVTFGGAASENGWEERVRARDEFAFEDANALIDRAGRAAPRVRRCFVACDSHRVTREPKLAKQRAKEVTKNERLMLQRAVAAAAEGLADAVPTERELNDAVSDMDEFASAPFVERVQRRATRSRTAASRDETEEVAAGIGRAIHILVNMCVQRSFRGEGADDANFALDSQRYHWNTDVLRASAETLVPMIVERLEYVFTRYTLS